MNNNKPELSSIQAVAVTGAAFLAAFHPGPYCIRTFPDGGGGPGKNYTVNRLAEIQAQLRSANTNQRQGIFFVVNQGGHNDAAISRVTAHFVEADACSLDEQYQHLMAFALPPSIIVKTRKSLHGYWLLKEVVDREIDSEINPAIKNQDEAVNTVANFRTVQKALAAYFKGDPVISNPSRVMRLPGFDHNKAAPLLVTCLKFEPDRRYTQAEISAALPSVTGPTNNPVKAEKPPGSDKNKPAEEGLKIDLILEHCAFIQYCLDNAASLSETLWFAMITNLANVPGGVAAIHRLSKGYPQYEAEATDRKIQHILTKAMAPMTCETIKGCGFACPQAATCRARRPRDLGIPPLAPWYLRLPQGLRFMPGVLARELIKTQAVLFVGEGFYEYQQGVYKVVEDDHCKRIIRDRLLAEHVRMNQINDVFGQWSLGISMAVDQMNPNPHIINVKNGLYDIKMGELATHAVKYPSTIQMKTTFDPEAEAPRFMTFLNDCLDRETQRLVQEIVGYLLIPETCAQKAFVFVGEGGAGKSTLLSVIQDLLLGRENVSNVPWHNLGDRFKTVEIFGKLANIFADLPSKNIDDNGMFKSITGEDMIIGERKNKNPFAFQATARLVFSCNEIPRNLGDRSEAFYRRLVIVPFLPAKPEPLRDLKLRDKLVSEAPGILNWALAGLSRLRENDFRFSESRGSRESLNSYRITGSSVLSFSQDHCCIETGVRVSASQLYFAYQTYAKDSGLKAVSQKRFWSELEGEYRGLEKIRDSKTRRIIYQGIDLGEWSTFE